jgi:hypothetical protein
MCGFVTSGQTCQVQSSLAVLTSKRQLSPFIAACVPCWTGVALSTSRARAFTIKRAPKEAEALAVYLHEGQTHSTLKSRASLSKNL